MENTNKTLINSLYELEEDHTVSNVLKNFLLACYEPTVSELPVYYGLPYRQYRHHNQEETSVMPSQSPVELFVKVLSYDTPYLKLGLRTMAHVPVPAAKILISS